jgi:hypothetical protein
MHQPKDLSSIPYRRERRTAAWHLQRRSHHRYQRAAFDHPLLHPGRPCTPSSDCQPTTGRRGKRMKHLQGTRMTITFFQQRLNRQQTVVLGRFLLHQVDNVSVIECHFFILFQFLHAIDNRSVCTENKYALTFQTITGNILHEDLKKTE